jgi:phytoene dehydrogenase-like protein
MQKTMIIVGAGIAGLSTGCYAQMNGYKTSIFELHKIPGGLCAAWTRKGYTFDISMHLLTNSKSGPFKKMWDELGVTKDQEFHYHDSIVVVEGKGKRLDFCLDRERFEKQMLAISPDDVGLIKEFNDLFFGKSIIDSVSLEPPELTGIVSKLKMVFAMIPMIGIFKKFENLTLQEFVARLKDPFLARALRSSVDTPGWPMLRYPMVALLGFAKGGGGAGYPLGGSQKVVFKIAKLYKKLGGKIHYKSRVEDVLIENDKAVGVRLEDGSVHKADIVVWAGDGHRLIFDILGGKYMDNTIREMYDKWLVVKPMVHVCFGVNMDLSKEPQKMVYEVEKPITIAGEEFKWISIIMHAFDKSTAPAGKSALDVWYATDYKYWEELIKDRAKYDAEKKRIAEETTDALEKKWPGFKSKIEVIDVPTPMTYVRYTDNWQGSVDGWYITPENMMKQKMKRSLPGLDNLYMVGQWTAPFTGTVMAALSGRQLIQILCKKDRRSFVTKTNNG